MLYAMLAACATLIFILVLAVPRAAEARRLARLFRAQQKWAEMTDPGRRTEFSPDFNAQASTRFKLNLVSSPLFLSFRLTLTHKRLQGSSEPCIKSSVLEGFRHA